MSQARSSMILKEDIHSAMGNGISAELLILEVELYFQNQQAEQQQTESLKNTFTINQNVSGSHTNFSQ